MTRNHVFVMLAAAAAVSACATAPEPLPEPEVVTVQPEPVRTCVSVAELRRIVIPEVTKKVIAITEISNPPYEPIQRREEQTRVVSPEYVYYVDDTGATITQSCEGPL